MSKFTDTAVADNVATIHNLIFNQGAFAGGVFAGDNFISSSWGTSILMNSGGIGSNSGSNGRSYDPWFSSFTVNIRTSTTSTTFDKRLLTVRPDGTLTVSNSLIYIKIMLIIH